jgi:hypothetical protein
MTIFTDVNVNYLRLEGRLSALANVRRLWIRKLDQSLENSLNEQVGIKRKRSHLVHVE